MSGKKVLVLMGSDKDLPVMQEAADALKRLGISFDLRVASAHRSPTKVVELAREARDQGYRVIIAGAGLAAHLAGVVAAHTTLPVIGVPLAAGELAGMDSLLSMVQMPKGIPVATVGIGPTGSYNAGMLAAAILALEDQLLAKKLEAYRKELAENVEEKDAALQRRK